MTQLPHIGTSSTFWQIEWVKDFNLLWFSSLSPTLTHTVMDCHTHTHTQWVHVWHDRTFKKWLVLKVFINSPSCNFGKPLWGINMWMLCHAKICQRIQNGLRFFRRLFPTYPYFAAHTSLQKYYFNLKSLLKILKTQFSMSMSVCLQVCACVGVFVRACMFTSLCACMLVCLSLCFCMCLCKGMRLF